MPSREERPRSESTREREKKSRNEQRGWRTRVGRRKKRDRRHSRVGERRKACFVDEERRLETPRTVRRSDGKSERKEEREGERVREKEREGKRASDQLPSPPPAFVSVLRSRDDALGRSESVGVGHERRKRATCRTRTHVRDIARSEDALPINETKTGI